MPRKKPFLPPGGFQAFAQQTPAVQALMRRQVGTRKKKKTSKKMAAKRSTTPKKKRRTGAKKIPTRMVKGSAAAKRHMAKLRKMRK